MEILPASIDTIIGLHGLLAAPGMLPPYKHKPATKCLLQVFGVRRAQPSRIGCSPELSASLSGLPSNKAPPILEVTRSKAPWMLQFLLGWCFCKQEYTLKSVNQRNWGGLWNSAYFVLGRTTCEPVHPSLSPCQKHCGICKQSFQRKDSKTTSKLFIPPLMLFLTAVPS